MKKSLLSVLAVTMMSRMRGPQFCLPYDEVTQADACDPNLNGLKATAWINSRKNITAYPANPASPASSDEIGIQTGDYTVAVGKPFVPIAFDHEVSDIKLEGAAPGVGPFKVTGKLFVRGSKAAIDGFASQVLYDDVVLVVQQPDGTRRPIGNADFPCRVKPMFDSKTIGATDPRGWEFEFTSNSVYSERLGPLVTVPLT